MFFRDKEYELVTREDDAGERDGTLDIDGKLVVGTWEGVNEIEGIVLGDRLGEDGIKVGTMEGITDGVRDGDDGVLVGIGEGT